MRKPFSARTQKYVRARAEANMTVTIRVLRMRAAPVLNQTTLVVTSAAPTTVYAGKANVHTASGAGATTVGEIAVDTRSTAISIPYNAPVPRQDDLVIVDAGSSDTDLNTRAFQVRDVDGGGLLQAVRTMSCVGYYESRYWEDE